MKYISETATKPMFTQSVEPAFGRNHHQNIIKAITTKLDKFLQYIVTATKPIFTQSIRPNFVGFTLAEVLITLGIIGVVAAITLPSIITKINNRGYSQALLKTYSELQIVTNQIVDEIGDTSMWPKVKFTMGQSIDDSNNDFIVEQYRKHFNVVNSCSENRWSNKPDCLPVLDNNKNNGLGLRKLNNELLDTTSYYQGRAF